MSEAPGPPGNPREPEDVSTNASAFLTGPSSASAWPWTSPPATAGCGFHPMVARCSPSFPFHTSSQVAKEQDKVLGTSSFRNWDNCLNNACVCVCVFSLPELLLSSREKRDQVVRGLNVWAQCPKSILVTKPESFCQSPHSPLLGGGAWMHTQAQSDSQTVRQTDRHTHRPAGPQTS